MFEVSSGMEATKAREGLAIYDTHTALGMWVFVRYAAMQKEVMGWRFLALLMP